MVDATISRARCAIWRVWAAPAWPQSGQLAPRDGRSHGITHLAAVDIQDARRGVVVGVALGQRHAAVGDDRAVPVSRACGQVGDELARGGDVDTEAAVGVVDV